MNHKNVKAVIFDLGGVILNINYQKTIEAFEKLGIKKSEKLYNQFDQEKLFDAYETGDLSSESFVTEIQKRLDKTVPKEAVVKAWNTMIGDFPSQKLDFINDLCKKIPCFLLSNTNELHLKKVQEVLQKSTYNSLDQLFEKCFYSHLIGKRKPHPETFQWVLKKMLFKADEVLFIDDSPQHIAGAKEAGLKTLFFEKETTFEEINELL